MLKELDGRDLVFNDGSRIPVPDGTSTKGPDTGGTIKLTAHARGGATSVTCELRVGATREYVQFVLDHMAREIAPHRA